MTGFYEFFSLPNGVEVTCPHCAGCATFTFAHVFRLEKKDVHLFEGRQFEIKQFNQRFAHICCYQCMAKQKHRLEWPNDAFYSLEFKGHSLWAFNKQMMLQIRDYIQAKDRNAVFESEPIVIRHLPTIFKLAKNREILVKKINKLIYSP